METETTSPSDKKAIRTEGIITGFSSRVDGSLSFRGSTPELTVPEKVALMSLQGVLVEMLLYPKDEKETEIVQVKKEMEFKSPSQRMRSVIFLLWKASEQDMPFESFYYLKMEGLIDWLKSKLPPIGEQTAA